MQKYLYQPACMCVCVHMCIVHVCMCAYVHVCMCACVYMCMCVCVCVHVCMCACVHVCMCACVYVCMCACVRVSMCACVYVYKITSHQNELWHQHQISLGMRLTTDHERLTLLYVLWLYVHTKLEARRSTGRLLRGYSSCTYVFFSLLGFVQLRTIRTVP